MSGEAKKRNEPEANEPAAFTTKEPVDEMGRMKSAVQALEGWMLLVRGLGGLTVIGGRASRRSQGDRNIDLARLLPPGPPPTLLSPTTAKEPRAEHDWLARVPEFADRIPELVDHADPNQSPLVCLVLDLDSLHQRAYEVRQFLAAFVAEDPARAQSLYLAALVYCLHMQEYDLTNAADAAMKVEWKPDPCVYQLWHRADTDEWFSVRLRAGVVTGCQKVTADARYWEVIHLAECAFKDQGLAAWAERHRGQFAVIELREEDDETDEEDDEPLGSE